MLLLIIILVIAAVLYYFYGRALQVDSTANSRDGQASFPDFTDDSSMPSDFPTSAPTFPASVSTFPSSADSLGRGSSGGFLKGSLGGGVSVLDMPVSKLDVPVSELDTLTPELAKPIAGGTQPGDMQVERRNNSSVHGVRLRGKDLRQAVVYSEILHRKF